MPTTRRLNFTQRHSISQQMAAIVLHNPENGLAHPTFDVELDLSPLNLPPDALIRIEAHRGRSSMRFDWGSVSRLAPPLDRSLHSVPFPPRFRVMALDADGSGRLLALGDKLTPRWQDERSSLLEVEFTDLGMEVWRLKFDENGGNPVLEVNKEIENINYAVRHDDAFRSLILPEILRSVLTRALLVECENPDDGEDGSNWSPWMRYTRGFYHEDFPRMSDHDDLDTTAIVGWIEGAVAAFTENQFRARTFYEGVMRR